MRRLRTAGTIVGAGMVAVLGVVASCTIFDGLESRIDGGGGDGGGDAVGDSVLPANTQPGYLALADGVKFCSNAFACPLLGQSTEFSIDVPVDSNHFSSCIGWVAGPLPKNRLGHDSTAKFLTCAAGATSCGAATGCMWYEVLAPGDPRCAGYDAGIAGACADDGGSLLLCNQPSVEHCNNAYFPSGASCMKGVDTYNYCARPTCSGDQCAGSMLEFCGATNKIYNGWDCAAGGFSCGFDSTEGYVDCLTDGTAKKCSALSVTCQSGIASICDGVYESHYDCNNYGGTCDQTSFPRCTLPGETCTPFDPGIDTCNGSSITLCYGGQKTTFDCASVGKTCVAGANGQTDHCQ
ncbi:MAG TPA: hypothetical protein VLM85_17675 [Polyangiaceae bacterium]|nr:hypothetical protein [Polyangiaceae bacterium]